MRSDYRVKYYPECKVPKISTLLQQIGVPEMTDIG